MKNHSLITLLGFIAIISHNLNQYNTVQAKKETKAGEEVGTCLLLHLDIKNELNLDIDRPVIKTVTGSDNALIAYQSNYALKMWANSWALAGWNPCFLNFHDAEEHPHYRQLLAQLRDQEIPAWKWPEYVRYLAMSVSGGGWYAFQSVLPFRSKYAYETGLGPLPNNGLLTAHQSPYMDLVSGSQSEWEKMSQDVLQDVSHVNVHYTNNLKHMVDQEFDSDVDAWDIITIQPILEFCEASKNKIAANVLRIAKHRMKSNNYKNFFLAAKNNMLRNCMRPIIYTFFSPALIDVDRLVKEVQQWKDQWADAGWRPIVLTLDDAKKHPLYEPFTKAFEEGEYKIGVYDRMCFYRWLAMAAATEGGFMSDNDTLPMHSNPVKSLNLPNNGKLTSYSMHVPAVVSGSKAEWDRVSHLLYENYMNNSNVFWSDMLALEAIYREDETQVIFEHDVFGVEEIYKWMLKKEYYNHYENINPHHYSRHDYCKYTLNIRALHFSHMSCKSVGFCKGNRETTAGNWIRQWKKDCLQRS